MAIQTTAPTPEKHGEAAGGFRTTWAKTMLTDPCDSPEAKLLAGGNPDSVKTPSC